MLREMAISERIEEGCLFQFKRVKKASSVDKLLLKMVRNNKDT